MGGNQRSELRKKILKRILIFLLLLFCAFAISPIVAIAGAVLFAFFIPVFAELILLGAFIDVWHGGTIYHVHYTLIAFAAVLISTPVRKRLRSRQEAFR